MQRNLRSPLFVLCALVFLWLTHATTVFADPVRPSAQDIPAAVTIVIDSTADPDTAAQRTCTFSGGAYQPAADGVCTLRRALVEASARPQSDRPITLVFDLADGDPNRNRDADGTWTIVLQSALPVLTTPSIAAPNGAVTIDGATQPGGRSNGPKILIGSRDSVFTVVSENNQLRNLAFLNGGTISLLGDGNLVENFWLGLSGDGQTIQLRTPAQPVRLATGGILIQSSNNVVRGNTIAGASTPAIAITSAEAHGNQILHNQIGTRADGSVPDVPSAIECLRGLTYDASNWYGGWGISITGSAQVVRGNRIVGLHALQATTATPPTELEIFGANHIVEQNVIGVDSEGDRLGVCGHGIKLSGSGTTLRDNTLVRTRTGFQDTQGNGMHSAILAVGSSPTFGGVSVRGNIIDSGPGIPYLFGPFIPAGVRDFVPARITAISGVNVIGTSGMDKEGRVSACPNCLVDFYLDDLDEIGETLAYLGSSTADASGTFSFTLSQPLTTTVGIRTTSTSTAAGVIGAVTGTTSAFSGLYSEGISVEISGPTQGEPNEFVQFEINVSPAQVAMPITITISATGIQPVISASDTAWLVSNLRWSEIGLKSVRVDVNTGLATASATHEIQIGDATFPLYMPNISR